MTKHANLNESAVRAVRNHSKSKIATIPRRIATMLNLQNGDILEWVVSDGKLIVTVRKKEGVLYEQ